MTLAASLTRQSQLCDIYLNDMLEFVAAIGNPREPEEKRQADALVSILHLYLISAWNYREMAN